MPIGISLEGGDHKDLLRKEAVPLGGAHKHADRSLLREGVGVHRNLVREGDLGI